MGSIYKITNNINNKIYIGQTSRLPQIRWQEHIREANKFNNIPLYNAFNKYGIENFSFEILEGNIKDEELNEKECYYIKFYNSNVHKNGYNVTDGGEGGRTSSKLTWSDIDEIINILQDKNSLISFSEISEKYHIDKSVISNINAGKTWRKEDISYPIRSYDTVGLTIPRNIYKEIVNEIKYSTKSLTEIRTKYNLSEEQMTSINNGYRCYSKDNLYYKDIYNGDFPIRATKQAQNINEQNIQQVIYKLIFTDLSCAKIGAEFGVQSVTINYINSGKRRKELTKNFILPIRANKEQNKEIYKSIYLD